MCITHVSLRGLVAPWWTSKGSRFMCLCVCVGAVQYRTAAAGPSILTHQWHQTLWYFKRGHSPGQRAWCEHLKLLCLLKLLCVGFWASLVIQVLSNSQQFSSSGIWPTSLGFAMLRHCPIPRFSSGPRRKMTKSSGKEKAPQAPPESLALELADPKEVTKEPIPPQKVLKIFSINIIAQSLPFCRRRVSLMGWITTMPFSMLVVMPFAWFRNK